MSSSEELEESSSEPPVADAAYSAALQEIEKRAGATGLQVERLDDERGVGLRLRFSDERVRNAVQIVRTADQAAYLLGGSFEFLRLVPEYAAVLDVRDGSVEVRVVSAAPLAMPIGNEILDTYRMTSPDGQAVVEFALAQSYVQNLISVRPPSAEPRRRSVRSIRFTGFGVSSVEQAKNLLDTLGASVLFELDLTRDISLRLARSIPINPPLRRRRWTTVNGPPTFPKNSYEREALELYMYGREARGMPLLEFLAYYQAVEFFFPRYSEIALRDRIEKLVKDPRFSPHNDRDVGRLVDVLREARGRGFGSEREQLRETLRSCIETDEVLEFLSDEDRRAHFGDKRSPLGVRPIPNPERETDLRDAIAERVYQLRCKIVHTKDGAGQGEIDLLLPNSPEARMLSHDIDLARMLAARVITASSSAPGA